MTKYIITGTILLLLISCGGTKTEQVRTQKDSDSLSLTQQQVKGVNVKFVQFSRHEIKPVIHANGVLKLLPESKAEVSSHISGKIERIFVREGMFVKQGQPLMSISSFDLLELQNEYVSAKNDAEFLKAEYERQDALQKRKMGVLSDFQSAKSKFQSAVIKEKTLKQKLEIIGIDIEAFKNLSNPNVQKNITIYSPLTGYINMLDVHVGSLVETHTILAEIIDPDKLQAEVYVYEKDADLMTINLPLTLHFVQQGIPSVEGKILFVSRALNPENKTITLHVQFDKPKGEQIHAGMNVKAVIEGISTEKSSSALPTTTLYDDGTSKYIFVTQNPKQPEVKMKKFRVQLVHEDDSFVVVQSIQKLPQGCWVADNNVLSLEAERKKNE